MCQEARQTLDISTGADPGLLTLTQELVKNVTAIRLDNFYIRYYLWVTPIQSTDGLRQVFKSGIKGLCFQRTFLMLP